MGSLQTQQSRYYINILNQGLTFRENTWGPAFIFSHQQKYFSTSEKHDKLKKIGHNGNNVALWKYFYSMGIYTMMTIIKNITTYLNLYVWGSLADY